MLDDLKQIALRDSQDALGLAVKQTDQLKKEYSCNISPSGNINNVVFAGMGGSALAALMSYTWPKPKLPFEIVRNYTVPDYVNQNTLFIASSYSGNTEETVSALKDAVEKKAQIVVIASGGKLADLAKKNSLELVELPGGMQPRMAAFYSFKALVTILDASGLTDNTAEELEKAADKLKDTPKQWAPDVGTSQNLAKQIAEEVSGRSMVVYSGPLMFPAAYKWKISFNENAKNVAWTNQYPEFNHNEFIGWSSHPVEKVYGIINLRSSFEYPRTQKRFEISDKLLSGRRPQPVNVDAEGDSALEHMLMLIMLGDFVSLYTALLNGLDPTPVGLIEKLKKELE